VSVGRRSRGGDTTRNNSPQTRLPPIAQNTIGRVGFSLRGTSSPATGKNNRPYTKLPVQPITFPNSQTSQ
jgi:hypothetical protein